MFGRLAAVAGALLLTSCATSGSGQASVAEQRATWAAQCKDWDEWDKPSPPFKIHGDTYYVGTCGISAIVIAGESGGHMLIDTGTEQGAQVVLENVRRLGFDPSDIMHVLQSHEHYDHVGGLAAMQAATGAQPVVNGNVADVYRTGRTDSRDPQFGMHEAMAPVSQIETFGEGQFSIGIGRNIVHAIATPGHTPGALSWTWRSTEGLERLSIVYADSLTPVSSDTYRFSDHPEYVAAFRASLDKVAALDCDILLTPHPSASGLRDKLIAGNLSGGTNCREYAEGLRKRLDERLAKEAAEAPQ